MCGPRTLFKVKTQAWGKSFLYTLFNLTFFFKVKLGRAKSLVGIKESISKPTLDM